ncbi:bacteriohemerythrin [Carboxylicivirga marina]|uniref:bacteriohemerythrin n=1 Tax=Carboxylicivirga marina TaxID=2800988 RepID=UPI001F1EDA34|nr:bacteriohemerythrin [Carboxylicivirga marina]
MTVEKQNEQIIWTDDLSVNSTVIDNEHKQLFALIDNFYKGIKDNSPKKRLEELILGLVDYTKTHFANEEEYMARMNYPNLSEHKELHQSFVAKVSSY